MKYLVRYIVVTFYSLVYTHASVYSFGERI